MIIMILFFFILFMGLNGKTWTLRDIGKRSALCKAAPAMSLATGDEQISDGSRETETITRYKKKPSPYVARAIIHDHLNVAVRTSNFEHAKQ